MGLGLRGFGVETCWFWGVALGLKHFQVGSYRYRSLIEGLYTF